MICVSEQKWEGLAEKMSQCDWLAGENLATRTTCFSLKVTPLTTYILIQIGTVAIEKTFQLLNSWIGSLVRCRHASKRLTWILQCTIDINIKRQLEHVICKPFIHEKCSLYRHTTLSSRPRKSTSLKIRNPSLY